MAEQVFLLMGEVWSMHNADTECTVKGERRPKGKKKFLCLNSSCLAIKYEFISHEQIMKTRFGGGYQYPEVLQYII